MIFERVCLCARDVETLVIQGHFSDQLTPRLCVITHTETEKQTDCLEGK